MNYMATDCFQPRVPVLAAQMQTLFFDTRIMKKLAAMAQVNGESAARLLDGDPNTFFLAGDRKACSTVADATMSSNQALIPALKDRAKFNRH
jgi:hypothetical protein